MCGTIRSLKSTYAASFIFDLHRKFVFLNFAARKRNIFSRPADLFDIFIGNSGCKIDEICNIFMLLL